MQERDSEQNSNSVTRDIDNALVPIIRLSRNKCRKSEPMNGRRDKNDSPASGLSFNSFISKFSAASGADMLFFTIFPSTASLRCTSALETVFSKSSKNIINTRSRHSRRKAIYFP